MKNRCLNFFKGLGCIFVIFIHFPFPGEIGRIISGLARFAVPLFFMISGYYAYNSREEVDKKMPRKIKHILRIVVYSTLLYIVYTIGHICIDSGINGIGVWIRQFCSPIKVFRMLFLGDLWCINGSGLWFVYTLLWSYIILYIINRYNLYRIAYKLMPILFLIRIIIFGCTNYYFVELHWLTVNNVLMTGLPYVMMGNFIAKHKEIILEKVSTKRLIIAIIIGIPFVMISEYTNLYIDVGYIGVIVYSVSIFLLTQKYFKNGFIKVFEIIGDKYFTCIYIIHMIIGDIVNKVFTVVQINGLLITEWLKPIVIVCVSIAGAMIWSKMLEFVQQQLINKIREDNYEK